MKNIFSLFTVFIVAFAIGCNAEDSTGGGKGGGNGGGPNPNDPATFEYKVKNKTFTGDYDIVFPSDGVLKAPVGDNSGLVDGSWRWVSSDSTTAIYYAKYDGADYDGTITRVEEYSGFRISDDGKTLTTVAKEGIVGELTKDSLDWNGYKEIFTLKDN